MHLSKYLQFTFCLLLGFSFENLFSQGSTTLTINTPQPTGDYIARDKIIALPGSKFIANGTALSHLYLDENILAPTVYSSSGSHGTAPIAYGLDLSKPVGTIPYNYNVTPIGSASCNIPIFAPSGTKGIEPIISIVYNSLSSASKVGYGWDISGISSISRTNRTIYKYGGQTNNSTNGIDLTNSDIFTLDNIRLQTISGNNGDPNTIYGTELEKFSRITSYNTIGNGPEWFKVETKEGLIIEYGNSTDSRLIPLGQTTVLEWKINKISDIHGNYMLFNYNNINGEAYVKEILYTGNTNANIPLYNSIKFYYEISQQPIATFVNGGEINETTLLRQIVVKADGQFTKKYDFNYSIYHTKSYLISIDEMGSDGSIINPLKFNYDDDNTSGTATNIIKTGSVNGPYFSKNIILDFNGDGKKDLVSFNYDLDLGGPTSFIRWFNWEPFKNIGNNTFQSTHSAINFPSNFQLTDVFPARTSVAGNMIYEVVDFNGDRFEDLVFVGSEDVSASSTDKILTFYPYLSNGTGFSTATPISITVKKDYRFFYFDGNGDGKQDIMVYSCDPIAGTSELWFYVDIIGAVPNHTQYSGASSRNLLNATVLDIDGDGASELVNITSTSSSTNKYFWKYANGSATFNLDNSNTFYKNQNYYFSNNIYMDNPFMLYGDFNGDGKTDFFSYHQTSSTTADWKMVLGKGDLTYKSININSTGLPISINNKFYVTRDINADGKTDILEFSENSSTHITLNTVNVYYSTGLTFIPETFNIDMTNFSGKIDDLNFGDFNGDGTDDLYIGSLNGTMDPKIFLFYRGAKSKRINEIYDGMGKSTKINFTPLTASTPTYAKVNFSNLIYPLSQFQGSYYVVSQTSTSNGIGGMNFLTYNYEDAIIHNQGKGFLGFKKMTTIDLTQDIKSISTYDFNTVFFNLFLTSSQSFINSSSSPLSNTTYQNSNVSINSGKQYFSKIDKITTINHLSNNTKVTDNTYDNNGNLTAQVVNLNSNFEIISTTSSYVQIGSWLPNKASYIETTATRNGETPDVRRVDYEYNAYGDLTKKITDVNSLANSTTLEYVIDPNTGLPIQQTMSSGSLQSKVTHWDYDTKFRFKIKSYNALNQLAEMVVDPKWSKPLSITGIDGLITLSKFDGFGNKIYSKTPDGIETNVKTEWAQSSDIDSHEPISVTNMVFKMTTIQPSKPTSIIYYDILGREIKTQTEGFTDPIFSVKSYNGRGLLYQESSNYQTIIGNAYTPVIKTYFYDSYGRISHLNATDGTNSLDNYNNYSFLSGNTIVSSTTPDGNTYSQTTDPSGLLISSTDNGGTILTNFYSNHKPKNLTINGIQMNYMEYDDVGHQTKLVDKNAGTTLYSYDAYGLLKSTIDANNNTHTYNYDILDRPTTKTNSSGVTSYQYVQTGNGLNHIMKVIGSNGIIDTYTYDNLNRPKSNSQSISGNVFLTSYDYDQFNNVSKITYPSGFAIKKEYKPNGYLKTIKRDDNSTLIWQQDEINPLGQSNKVTYGNLIQTVKTFNNFGNLSNITSGSIQNLTLNFNILNGNLNSRVDNIKGLTENFTYDNLNRITQSLVVGTTNQIDITYNQIGNILNKTDVGNTTFNASKINAIETATNPIPDISLLQQDITYTPFNKTAAIIEDIYEYNITYGPLEERVKTELFNQGVIEKTKYYQANYEKEITTTNTREIHYISGTNAMYIIDNGVGAMYYNYTDHLGSINTITDANGSIMLEQNFDAWGRKRNPVDWSYTPIAVAQPLSWFSRGFTGHEHIYEFGLINMNGRMYSAIEGQMLSPDSYNQDPNFTQNYNRYLYAYNNPLKFTDPTGNLTFWDVLAGAAVVVGVILLATGYGSAIGGVLVGAGIAHFGVAVQEYQHGGSWNNASNYSGINLSITFNPNWGNKTQNQPKDFEFNDYDRLSNNPTVIDMQASQDRPYNTSSYTENFGGIAGLTLINFGVQYDEVYQQFGLEIKLNYTGPLATNLARWSQRIYTDYPNTNRTSPYWDDGNNGGIYYPHYSDLDNKFYDFPERPSNRDCSWRATLSLYQDNVPLFYLWYGFNMVDGFPVLTNLKVIKQ